MANKSELQELYRNVVKRALGIDAHVDSEGDVTFEIPLQGAFYILLDAQNDPEYFMLVYPNFFNVTKESYVNVLSAMNAVNSKNKAVKLSFRENDKSGSVKATVEMFIAAINEVPDEKLLGNILKRTLGAIVSGVKAFSEAMPQADKTSGGNTYDTPMKW